jgi:hypothetical protein
MAIDLHTLLASVDDEASFIAFVDALHADFVAERELEATTPSSPYGPGVLGWENGTVDKFLDAAASWGSATLESGKGATLSSNPWHRCAHILLAGKFYE